MDNADQIATQTADKIIKNFREQREAKKELIKQKKSWPEYMMCNDCKRHGIKRKYHKDTMLHTPHIITRFRRGKYEKVTMHVHRCPSCRKTYKPQKGRIINPEKIPCNKLENR